MTPNHKEITRWPWTHTSHAYFPRNCYYTVQYCTVLYCTVQYCTVLNLPIFLDLPTTHAVFPNVSTRHLFNISSTPSGVAGMKAGCPITYRPRGYTDM